MQAQKDEGMELLPENIMRERVSNFEKNSKLSIEEHRKVEAFQLQTGRELRE